MSKETENYGLYLEDDNEAKFKDWRKKMNGSSDSNMVKIDTALAAKQDKLNGTPGQVVGFDEDGHAVPQGAPDTGVTSFNGRSGEVMPQDGDYTAAQVGARPADWMPTAAQVGAVPISRTVNGVALNGDISLTAADVGAVTAEQVNAAIQEAVLDSWEKSY